MTGFRIVSPIFKALRNLAGANAGEWAPDVKLFLKRSLTTAIQSTPTRSVSLIKKNQRRQYSNRANYIPSFHELLDPTLIVKPDGTEWLYCGGKWYRPDQWHLPDPVYEAYLELKFERAARLETKRDDFIAFRAQARFLYKKSWWEIGQSVGIDVPCSQQVKDAVSRRSPSQLKRGYKQNPPRGYAQERGGKGVYSIVIYNPFLDDRSQYWTGNGKAIIAQAMQKHRVAYEEKVAERQYKLILRLLKTFLA